MRPVRAAHCISGTADGSPLAGLVAVGDAIVAIDGDRAAARRLLARRPRSSSSGSPRRRARQRVLLVRPAASAEGDDEEDDLLIDRFIDVVRLRIALAHKRIAADIEARVDAIARAARCSRASRSRA